jgi:UDP-glucose 4-epimerase
MKKVIVTGANGFIGTALCKKLSDEGINVIAIVRNKEENITKIKDIPRLKITYCDLSDFRNLSKYVEDRDIDALYHLAWIGSAGTLRGDSDVQIRNIQYTCDTVKACLDMNCKRFIFASSIMEYEIQATMVTDTMPSINTLYSSAKVAADYMARTLSGSYGIDYIRAVISNIYGPGETSPRLVNTSLRKMLNNEHCAFSTGNQLYDFVYITDAAKMFIEIGRYGIANRTYYIGSQEPRPLKEFLCEMRDQVDPDIEIGLGEIPFNGVSLSYKEFDINAVKKDTGYIPEVTFAQGIKNTLEWIKEME